MITSILPASALAGEEATGSADEWKYGLNGDRGFNEETFAKIKRNTDGGSDSSWRDGSMTGNGTMGLIEGCDPAEDVIIYNDTRLVLGTNDIFEVADVAANIDEIRKSAADRSDPGKWQGWVREYWSEKYGTPANGSGHLSSNTKEYHPAAQLRIKNNDYVSHDTYNRYTDFETGEIGMQWKAGGKEYNSRTFISRADNVAVTIIEAPEGDNLNLTLSIDNLLEMGIDSVSMKSRGVEICPESKEIVQLDGNGYSIGQVVKYGDFDAKGKENGNPDAHGAKGGYATAIRLIAGDGAQITANENPEAHQITANKYFNTNDDTQTFTKNITTPTLTVTNTNSIMLISKVDVRLTGLKDIDAVESALYPDVLADVDAAAAKYGAPKYSPTDPASVNNPVGIEEPVEPVKSLPELYLAMLAPHKAIHGGMFNGTTLTLCVTTEEKADRELTNSALNQKQQNDKENINKAWLERLYDNGRFGLICASGYNTSRLGGIWVGNWMPDWSGDFTQDANVNLQVSSVNTTGLKDAARSYITYILRQASDWETNAKNIYGIDDAIMVGPRTDGDGNGQIYHTLTGYPFLYWNAGTDWLLIPIYEYWQCYGNEKIPVGKDVDLTELTSVLDLDDEKIEDIQANGFDLEQHILAPLLKKLYNFWKGYTSDKFFISADGKTMHLNDGAVMGETDKFMFTPGYSPENVPDKDGDGYNGSPSLAANTTMDISAAHDSMSMVRAFVKEGKITDITDAEITAFENKFPEYLTASDGALKEWAVADYEEHYNHRHVSHTYGAWPGYEAQNNYTLRSALATALDMRYTYNVSDNAQAHGHLHNALVEARIKRVPEYEKCLHTLIASNYEYAALMTSHNRGHGSAFCTDNAFGLLGVVTEGLIYSDTGVIELLPALIDSFTEGEITDLVARTNAEVESLKWNKETVTAKITSNKDNNKVKLMCGEAWSGVTVDGVDADAQTDSNGEKYIELTLNANESKTVVFTRNEIENGTYHIKNTDGQSAESAGRSR